MQLCWCINPSFDELYSLHSVYIFRLSFRRGTLILHAVCMVLSYNILYIYIYMYIICMYLVFVKLWVGRSEHDCVFISRILWYRTVRNSFVLPVCRQLRHDEYRHFDFIKYDVSFFFAIGLYWTNISHKNKPVIVVYNSNTLWRFDKKHTIYASINLWVRSL